MSQPNLLDKNNASPVTRFVRKRYPLINLKLPISFLLDSGAFDLETSEISHEEVRVSCPAAEIPKLVPRTAHHRPDEKILHSVQIQLNNKQVLTLKLQVSFCRRSSQKAFKVGLRFHSINEEDQRSLQVRLEQALAGSARPASIIN
ncbi:PilZ domain-containing protein [Marinospirillum celere]|uniref:PilZ domain-containing protein n=2 Tax=Marinospirillum celere TaxID=1122252 RepID=A0A1I1FQ31_9GAMM|nr:PilZ domain-containing protein [Marinospirillum celere]